MIERKHRGSITVRSGVEASVVKALCHGIYLHGLLKLRWYRATPQAARPPRIAYQMRARSRGQTLSRGGLHWWYVIEAFQPCVNRSISAQCNRTGADEGRFLVEDVWGSGRCEG